MKNKKRNEFEQLKNKKQASLLREFIDFIFENKKWWMIPILIVFALIGLLAVLSSTGAAPFIYPFF